MEQGFLWLAKAFLSDPKKLPKAVSFIPRVLTSPIRTLPDFIVMGFPKCGTTSLYAYLTEHPQIGAAFQKEIFFFIWHTKKGMLWYRANFPTVIDKALHERGGKKFLTGEATPSYILYPETYEKIRKMNPKVKLILMLRNPVDKAFSNFNHLMKEGLAGEGGIEGAIKRDLQGQAKERTPFHSIVSSGIYVDYIRKLHEVFPREQVLIVRSEDFFSDPRAVTGKCFRFLGLMDHPLEEYKNHNPGGYGKDADSPERKMLADFYRPHNKRLYDYLGVDFGWD